MQSYIIRRLLQSIPLLIGISLISFLIMQLAPGDYLSTIRMNPDISAEMIDQLEKEFGLDKSAPEQYLHWLWRALQLDFGRSFSYRVPVSFLVKTRMLNTLYLSLAAMFLAWLVAIPIGIHAATHKYQWSDHTMTVFSLLGLSIPNFFLALLLLFSIVKFNINLPISGMTSIDYEWLTMPEKIIDILRHLLVPALVLGTSQMAGLMRQMRGQMIDTMRQDYVTTARSKGLTERIVVYKHVLRNALNPLITIFGFQFSILLSGAALTEIVTGWPGMGNLTLQAVLNKDYYVVMAALMVGGFLLIIGNLLADILLAVSDPRIRYH